MRFFVEATEIGENSFDSESKTNELKESILSSLNKLFQEPPAFSAIITSYNQEQSTYSLLWDARFDNVQKNVRISKDFLYST